MQYRVKDAVIATLRSAPSADASVVKGLGPQTDLGDGKPSTDELWIEVDVPPDHGWVVLTECDKQGAAGADDEAIAIKSVLTDWKFNTSEDVPPWSVFADFLIARKIFVSANNGPLPGEDGVGPMLVTTAEWTDFLTNGGELKNGRTAAQRNNPIIQIEGAAWRMHADAKKMHDLRIAAGKATDKDPFVPSFLDVFFAYLTGSPAAALAILDAQTPPHIVAIDQVLQQPSGPLGVDQVKALLTARESFFGKPTNPKLLKDVVAITEKFLNGAFEQAFTDISNFIPEALPVVSGAAPWLDVAKAAEAAGIAEANPGDKNTILDYFKATNHPRPTSVTTPWCGAFAAHCMKASGSEVAAASIPRDAAAAACWKMWGSKLAHRSVNVPPGAVVVLSPTSETGGTGHVGFFVKFSDDKKQVFLLGGNQSNKVCTIPFPTSQIAYVGWLDLAPAQAKVGALTLPPGIQASHKPNATLIVDKFAAAGFGRVQQITAVANAIAESSLDPMKHNTHNEDSVGLFQLFRIKGVGGTHSVGELQDPAFNTDLIIAEAKKYPSFGKATTLAKAMDVFVTLVERPANPQVQIAKRLDIAEKLIA